MNLYDVEECRCIIIPRNNIEANAAVQRYIIDKEDLEIPNSLMKESMETENPWV